MDSGRALSRLFLVHAAITAAAGIVLLVAPGLIPGAVGIRLDPAAFLLCYLLAAAEFGFAFLSYWGARLTNPEGVRVLVLACVVLHVASALLEALAIARGASAVLWGNVAARALVAGLFLHFIPPRRGQESNGARTEPARDRCARALV